MAAPVPLVVFTRAPGGGAAKTRLARDVGPEVARALAGAFLQDVWAAAAAAPGIAPVLALDGDPGSLPPLAPAPRACWPQGEGDLGARMARALRRGIAAAGRALLVGSDLPGLPPEALAEAARALDDADAVLGPAEDGGFWLLGLRACPPGLLDGLPWSAPDTLARTLARLVGSGLRTRQLGPWADVDTAPDLARVVALAGLGAVDAPHTLAAARGLALPPPTAAAPARLRGHVSVILPVLDEIARLPRRLRELMVLDGVGEVLVADGGSADGSDRVAALFPGVRLVRAPRGRARQMNAAAAVARGDVLLFLHADVALPADAIGHVERALARPGAVGGAFRTRHVSDGGRYRLGPLLRLADVRSRVTSAPYGDQAIFVRARDFAALGGFPDVPLMEDLAFSRALASRGRLVRVPAEVRVSGRRFETRPVYYTALVNVFPLLYRLGVPPSALARLYHHTR